MGVSPATCGGTRCFASAEAGGRHGVLRLLQDRHRFAGMQGYFVHKKQPSPLGSYSRSVPRALPTAVLGLVARYPCTTRHLTTAAFVLGPPILSWCKRLRGSRQLRQLPLWDPTAFVPGPSWGSPNIVCETPTRGPKLAGGTTTSAFSKIAIVSQVYRGTSLIRNKGTSLIRISDYP